MQLIFSDQALPSSMTKSLFLAGPSPRTLDQLDWRHEAVNLLAAKGFDGTIFLPVPSTVFNRMGETHFDYDNQVSWEESARKMADCIVFWVPRVIDQSRRDLGMPGFTTNFELGEDLNSGKLVYGRPELAVKCKYLDHRVEGKKLDVQSDLGATLDQAIQTLGTGAFRENGETLVPLFIWNTPQFKSWYTSLRNAGNVLKYAEILHNFKTRRDHVFSYVLSAHIWIKAENRVKSNEIVFARPDICVVVAHGIVDGTQKVALIKEFRSPVNNEEGYVYELPSGSSADLSEDSLHVAQHELHEELGLAIEDPQRFKLIGERQLVATFATHKAKVYSVELSPAELTQLEAAHLDNQPLGLLADSEQTFVRVANVAELFNWKVDYSTLGIIFEAITSK